MEDQGMDRSSLYDSRRGSLRSRARVEIHLDPATSGGRPNQPTRRLASTAPAAGLKPSVRRSAVNVVETSGNTVDLLPSVKRPAWRGFLLVSCIRTNTFGGCLPRRPSFSRRLRTG